MDKIYNWRSTKDVKEHIDKHIIDDECNEKRLWEKEFEDLDKLKESYKKDYENSLLFEIYEQKPNEFINDSELKYVYKSYGHYSCNVKRDEDNLTACLSLFNDWRVKPYISSCFFKKNIVIDSLVLLMSNQLLKKTADEVNYKFEGLTWTYENNLKKAFYYAHYDTFNDTPNIIKVRKFIYKYLELQLKHMIKDKSINLNDYIYYYYLIKRLSELDGEISNSFNKFIYSASYFDFDENKTKTLNIINKRKKEINNLVSTFGDNVEGYKYELAMLNLCLASMDFYIEESDSKIAFDLISEGLLR